MDKYLIQASEAYYVKLRLVFFFELPEARDLYYIFNYSSLEIDHLQRLETVR